MAAPVALAPGAQVGAYRIDRILGRGGMGVVYRALDAQGNEVALKVLTAELETDPEALRRFEREAIAATKVRHPNVARCIESGSAGGVRFLALELVPGGSLRDRLERQGSLGWLEAASVGAQIARGLAAVHAAGVVHRDLKPDNVLLARDGTPRLTDFGLVRRAPDRTSISARGSLTQDGTLLGTPAFMAPEQIDHPGDVDERADLYALGATIFALLTGRPPFLGDGIALLKDVLTTPPPRPKDFGECPAALEDVVLRLLSKSPVARPKSAQEVAVALEEIAGVGPAHASPARSPARGLVLALAAGVLVVGGALVGAVLAGRGAAVEAPVPPSTPAATNPVARSAPVPVAPSGQRKVTLRVMRTLAEARWSRHVRLPWKGGGTCAFLADGRPVTGAWDALLRIWDPETLEQVRELRLPYLELGLRALRGPGRIIVGEDAAVKVHPSTAQIVDVDGPTRGFELRTPEGEGAVRRILATADERSIVLASDWGTVSRWDMGGTRPVNVWTQHVQTQVKREHANVFAAALSPDEKLVAIGCAEGHVRFYDFVHGTLVRDRTLSEQGITYCAYTPDGAHLLATAYVDEKENAGELIVIDPATGTARTISYFRDGRIDAIATFPDSRTFATGSGGVVDLWDLEQGLPVRRLLDRPARRPFPGATAFGDGPNQDLVVVREIALSPDGQRLLGISNMGFVDLWDVSSGTAPRSPGGPLDDPARHLAVSADGRTALIAGALGPIQVLSLASGTFQDAFPAPVRAVALALSPDGSRACAVDLNGFVATWDVATRERAAGWPAKRSAVAFVDAAHLVVPDEVGALRIQAWETASGAAAPTGSMRTSVHEARVGPGDRLLTVSPTGIKLSKASTGAFLEERSTRKGETFMWAGFAGDSVLVANPERVSLISGSLASKPVWETTFPKEKAYAVAATSDGAHVLVATGTGSLVLLDGKTGVEVDRMDRAADAPTDVAAIPGSAKFLVGTANGGLFELEAHAE